MKITNVLNKHGALIIELVVLTVTVLLLLFPVSMGKGFCLAL